MVSPELDGLDAPVCPLLGLAADRRSHFTYPHPGHRCFAKRRPTTTDARRQAAYCLSPGYTACDRYEARKREAKAGDQPQPQQSSHEPSASPGGTPADALDGAATVIHVFRDGNSLTRIATVYGLTVEQIATANGFTLTDAIAGGTRLVVPLRASAVNVSARAKKTTAGT